MREVVATLLFRIWPGLKSRLRISGYRMLGMQVGPRCRFERVRARRVSQITLGPGNALSEGCWLWPVDAPHSGIRITIGTHNYFNRDCMIDACGSVMIGDNNMFGPGVYMTDSNHSLIPGKRLADCPMEIGRIIIGNGCWIGAKAVILKDVILGDRCVIAAGAVVTKSFPAGSVVAGVPAKLLKQMEEVPV
jgi:acetyltransferase-like isoleucine patch superfamily enzyme